MDLFIHAANILYVFSYSVRDILWLRVLTVVAATTLLPFYYAHELWTPIAWQILFMAINAYQIYRLLLERRPVEMSERERELYQRVFRSFRPRDFMKLLRLGNWRDAAPDEQLVTRDEPLDEMLLIYSGNVAVVVDDQALTSLADGAFVGEMSYITGQKPSADVKATAPTAYVAWPVDKLREFLGADPELRASWQFLIGSDLANKLRAA